MEKRPGLADFLKKRSIRNRILEMREDLLLATHRTLSVTCGALLTSACCSFNFGTCRPLPLYYYLGNTPPSSKYAREPVSSVLNIATVALILLMQAGIEWKKYNGKKADKRMQELAANAQRNLQGQNLSNFFCCNIKWCHSVKHYFMPDL